MSPEPSSSPAPPPAAVARSSRPHQPSNSRCRASPSTTLYRYVPSASSRSRQASVRSPVSETNSNDRAGQRRRESSPAPIPRNPPRRSCRSSGIAMDRNQSIQRRRPRPRHRCPALAGKARRRRRKCRPNSAERGGKRRIAPVDQQLRRSRPPPRPLPDHATSGLPRRAAAAPPSGADCGSTATTRAPRSVQA